MAKPSYSSTSLTYIKSKFRQDIISPTKQLDRWAEYYKDLASDPSGHSLNRNYWNHALRNISLRSSAWNINGPITIEDIKKKTISSMKNNKAPCPYGIPIEFYEALFYNEELLETHPVAENCLKLIFNKIWNGSFSKKWNSASIVSIPKKGDLSDCSNYRGISLINVGLKIISKIITDRISTYALTHNFIRPEQFGFSQPWRMH